MPTNVRGQFHIEAKKNTLPFGPWDFFLNAVYTELFAAQIQLASLTFAQMIGGTLPAISAITQVRYLAIVPDQTIRVGLHGVNAQSTGFTLLANQPLAIGTCLITQLSLYNTAAVATNILLVIGGD